MTIISSLQPRVKQTTLDTTCLFHLRRKANKNASIKVHIKMIYQNNLGRNNETTMVKVRKHRDFDISNF